MTNFESSSTATDDYTSYATLFCCRSRFLMCLSHVSLPSPALSINQHRRLKPVNARNFAAHRTYVGAQLAAICLQWSSVPNEKRSTVAALRYTASAIQELRGYITI